MSTLESMEIHQSDDPMILGCAGGICARAGRTEEARKLLDKLARLSKERYISPFDVALIHIGLGKKNETLDFLEKAYDDRTPRLAAFLKTDPRFDALRSEERFRNLLELIGV